MKSSPPFPTDHEALIADFHSKGSYSFEFDSANGAHLKKAIERLNKSAKKAVSARTLFEKIGVLVYSSYIDLVHDLRFRKDQGSKWALMFYSAAIHHISTIDGKKSGENRSLVTFNARV